MREFSVGEVDDVHISHIMLSPAGDERVQKSAQNAIYKELQKTAHAKTSLLMPSLKRAGHWVMPPPVWI